MKPQTVTGKMLGILLMLIPFVNYAQTDTAKINIPMKGKLVYYEESFGVNTTGGKDELFSRAVKWLAASFPDVQQNASLQNKANGTIAGTGIFKVVTSSTGNYYWLKFDINVAIANGKCTISTTNYYEEPIEKGITNEYSKIEYRWRDYRKGKPWSVEDKPLFTGLHANTIALLASFKKEMGGTGSKGFKVLALYENGGPHLEYSKRAIIWLDKLAAENGFTIDYVQNTDKIDEAFLSNYQLFIQLDFPPYAWKDKAVTAFQNYIDQGKGGWIGFHHATLLGEFDGYPMWNWFYQFMGGITFKNYIATFAKGQVNIEDKQHPVMKDVPPSFLIQQEEWYTYDKSPRPNVHVIASVDESTYQPQGDIKMGDHPVIWTNEHVKARNVYIFMGHSPNLFDNPAYTKLFSNAIFWAAGK